MRKLGAPGHEEFAVGALASGGRIVLNDDVVRGLRVTPAQLRETAEQGKAVNWSAAKPSTAPAGPARRHRQDRHPGR